MGLGVRAQDPCQGSTSAPSYKQNRAGHSTWYSSLHCPPLENESFLQSEGSEMKRNSKRKSAKPYIDRPHRSRQGRDARPTDRACGSELLEGVCSPPLPARRTSMCGRIMGRISMRAPKESNRIPRRARIRARRPARPQKLARTFSSATPTSAASALTPSAMPFIPQMSITVEDGLATPAALATSCT